MPTPYNLSTGKIRYWLFRFRTEATGGPPALGAPDGLRGHFEALEWFSEWPLFGVTWDVHEARPLDIRPIKESLDAGWNLEAAATEIPGGK